MDEFFVETNDEENEDFYYYKDINRLDDDPNDTFYNY